MPKNTPWPADQVERRAESAGFASGFHGYRDAPACPVARRAWAAAWIDGDRVANGEQK